MNRTIVKFKDFTLVLSHNPPIGKTKVLLYDELYHDPIAVFTLEEFEAQLRKLAIEFGPKAK